MNRLNFHKAITCLAVYAACFTTLLYGQETDPAFAHITAETCVLVRIDPAALDGLIQETRPTDKATKQAELQRRLKRTRDILDGDPVWLTVGFPQMPLSTKILVRDPDGKRIKALKELWDFLEPGPYNERPSVVVIDSFAQPDSQHAPAAASRMDQWKKLMATQADGSQRQGTIQFAYLPPVHLYDTYRELLTELPDYLGGGPITLLTEGMQSVSGTFDVKTGELEAAINSASPTAAEAFAQRATRLLTSFFAQRATQMIASFTATGKVNQQPLAPFYQHLNTSTFKSDERQVRWQIPVSKTWQPGKDLEFAIASAFNRSTAKRLRELALGMHNYESATGHFPPSLEAREPKTDRLSWRVHILPFLGESELYDKFALDEPWDSPTNIKLLPEMPNVFSDYGSRLLAPVDAKPGYTTIVAPSSERTILGAPRKVTFRSIADGTSNTILLVIVKDKLAVPWTAPRDYVFAPKAPAAGLKFTDGKTPVVFGDASTHLLVQDNDWKALFEMNDGKVVQPK